MACVRSEGCPFPSFEELIAPTARDRFFETIFEREALQVRHDGQWVMRLAEEIDPFRIVRDSCRHWGEVSLARADLAAADCLHTKQPPSEDGVRHAFAEGYTIVINDLQIRDEAVARLCRSFEQAFFCRANVNLYLTGPDSAGLACHYDDDDVFIVQLRGRKHWRLYPHRDRLPLGRGDYQGSTDWGEAHERRLQAGDILYLPRGMPHEARTAGEPSLHLTVSLNLVRWAELASELVYALAGHDAQLRRAVPLALLDGRNPEPSAMPPLIASLLANETLRVTALERVQSRLLAGASRLGPAESGGRGAPSSDQFFTVADDQIWSCLAVEEGLVIQAIGARFELGPDMADVIAHLRSGSAIRADDLPASWPIGRRLDLIKAMVDAGFLVSCFADRKTRSPLTTIAA